MANIPLRTRLEAIPTPDESYAALFGGNAGGIVKLKLLDLKPYPNQPFAPYTAEKLSELAQDIAENGVLSPIIVRKMEADEDNTYGYYQILAGHNRVQACRLIGLEDIPAIVKNVDDNTAKLILVNTNLNQRDKLLPSEKAFAYKMQLDSIKQQGKRNDLDTSRPVGERLESADIVGSGTGESGRQIQRYIRLTYLIPTLLDLADNDNLPFRAGVELSYLSGIEQEILNTYITDNNIKISLAQAEDLRKYSKEIAPIDRNVLDRTFKIERVKNPPTTIKLKYKTIRKYIPPMEDTEVEGYILKALEFYQENGGGFD